MIGKIVSHYKIISKLGEGGMGVVYKAEDDRLGRLVALKFLPPSLTSKKTSKTRFIHEARAASSLEHPNICAVYDIGETEDGQMFIAMPHYEGETLEERMAKGPLDVVSAIDIIHQLATGLAKAHENGIIHRDIKPGNIFITNDGFVKILDFGLAKLATEPRLTRTGTTLGTISYMSPEQASGGDVDVRSDIFSLGTVFYELLTGRLPFRGDHAGAIIYGILNNDPEPLQIHRNDAPEGLQRVVDKALAKNVDERYQSAHALIEDISEFGPPTGGFAGSPRRGGAPLPRPRIFAGLAGVAIIVALVASLWPVLRGPGTAEGVTLAVVDFNDISASGDSTRTVGMGGLIHVGLVENSPCRVVSPTYLLDLRRRLFGAERGRIEDSQVLELARKSGATMLLSGQLGELEGRPYVTWQLVDTASGQSIAAHRAEGSGVAALADEIVEGVLPVLASYCGADVTAPVQSVTELTTANPEAYDCYVAVETAGALMPARERTELLEKAVALDSTFALAHLALAKSYRGARRLSAARESTEKAWRWRSRLSIKDRMRLDGWRDQLNYRVMDATEVYRELNERWPDDKNILRELSDVLWWWRYHRECLEVIRRALVLYPDDAHFLDYYQALLASLDHPDDALEAAHNLVRQYPDNPNNWDELASRFIATGLPDSAEAALLKVLELDPERKEPKLRFADLKYFRGDLAGAIKEHERLYEQFSRSYDLRLMYREAGQYQRALELYDEGRSTPEDPVDRYLQENFRNRFLITLGRAEEVLRWTDRVTDDLLVRGGADDDPQLMGIVRMTLPSHRGQALVAMDSLEAARDASSELMDRIPEFGNLVWIHALRVDVKIELKEGRPDAVLVLIDQLRKKGVALETWNLLENLTMRAEAYRMSGRLDEAAAVHKRLLRIRGGHALSHYHLGVIYQHMGRTQEAWREFSRFLEMWSEADEGLPQLEDARSRLAALRDGSG